MSSNKPGNSFRRNTSYAFPVKLSKTKGPLNLLPSTPYHTFTVNLLWRSVTLVSCGLSWDHVSTFRKLFTSSRVKDASSLNEMTLNSSGWAFTQCVNLRTTSLSDCNETLGREPVSRTVCWIRVNTLRDGILRSGKRLWYSWTAARALPSQNPYTKFVSQYSTWETQKAFYQHRTTNLPTIQKAALNWTACAVHAAHFLCSEVQWPPSAEIASYETTLSAEWGKIVSQQVPCVDPQKDLTFLWPLSP